MSGHWAPAWRREADVGEAAGTGRGTAVVLMGVSGCGKSRIGSELAARLGWPMVEGDALHPESNVAKMAAGTPLTDGDRRPWLEAVRDRLDAEAATGPGVVVSCSSLKRAYRDLLRTASARVVFIELDVARSELARRVSGRRGHFMPVSLLNSQLATLEPLALDEDGRRVASHQDPRRTLEEVVAAVGGLMACEEDAPSA